MAPPLVIPKKFKHKFLFLDCVHLLIYLMLQVLVMNLMLLLIQPK
jgi:hypothetical protein